MAKATGGSSSGAAGAGGRETRSRAGGSGGIGSVPNADNLNGDPSPAATRAISDLEGRLTDGEWQLEGFYSNGFTGTFRSTDLTVFHDSSGRVTSVTLENSKANFAMNRPATEDDVPNLRQAQEEMYAEAERRGDGSAARLSKAWDNDDRYDSSDEVGEGEEDYVTRRYEDYE